MKNIYVLITSMVMSMVAYSQADFETFGSGDWSNAGTWTVTSGTDIDYIPDADDNVTILDGHNVIVSGSEQEAKNLTLQGTTGTRLNVNGTTLNLFGTLKGPGSNFTNEILSTDGTGLIKFKGGSRALFSTWSYGPTAAAWLWRMEVALDPGFTGTASGIRASYMKFSSGTYSGSEIRVDSTFSDGSGVIIIDEGATVRFSVAIGNRLVNYTPSYCRSITVNGALESTSQGKIYGQSIFINGKLLHKGYNPITSYPNGMGVSEFVYGNGSIVEYARSGILKVGDEIDRSTLPNSVPDTASFAGGNQYNAATVELDNDTLSAKNVKFGEYGRLLITLGRLILPANAAIIGADSDHFIETDGGDVLITGVGSTAVLFPVGPSSTEYNPVTIINNGVVDDFIVKAMSSRPQCLGPYPLTSINYQWDIKEVVPGGSNVTLSLGYSDDTKRGSQYIPASAEIVHCTGATADFWDGSGESGTAPYTVSGGGFTQFSLFGITSEESILPLTFMQSFTSIIKNEDVALSWKVNCTASSVTMDLEHASGNPDNFKMLYSIHADAARCNLPFNYVHAMAADSDNYYRIKITDIDGSISYSKIIHAGGTSEGIALSILPNPVRGSSMEIHIVSDRKTQFAIHIMDMQGRVMKITNPQSISQGTNVVRLDIGNLHSGIYIVRCFEKGKLLQISRLVKQ